MNPCIEVKNLSKSFKGRCVVKNLSFAVNKQEVFGLLGHNGAGKSTTIETLLGLKKADSGTVSILGKEPRKHRKEIFEKVGVQLQASNYQNAIRVDEICQEISVLYREPADYHALLQKFKLESLEKAQVNKLSGGERQKLSVVLALIPNPEIIFLDELTTGLDTAARREVWRNLTQLKEEGTTIVLTTHYMEEAESLCDRICLIKEGQKVVEGTVKDVIAGSPYDNLEEAYLWYMGEEVLL
ncbi:MAG: ABC transporter ATP-binding protein [Lachnospiraceae bacterium]|nr:ABC transporter ATP-binding protein [Lachnospiraceae bacterium]